MKPGGAFEAEGALGAERNLDIKGAAVIQEVVAVQDVADVEQIAELNMMPELEHVSAAAAAAAGSLNKPVMSKFPVGSFNMEMSFHLHGRLCTYPCFNSICIFQYDKLGLEEGKA